MANSQIVFLKDTTTKEDAPHTWLNAQDTLFGSRFFGVGCRRSLTNQLLRMKRLGRMHKRVARHLRLPQISLILILMPIG